MRQLETVKVYYRGLDGRDQKLIVFTSILLAITLFYTLVWEPIHQNLERQIKDNENQSRIHQWMKSAATEVTQLRSSGNRPTALQAVNSPVSIIAEQSAKSSGLGTQVSKIESSGKSSAKIFLKEVSFDQLILWLHLMRSRYGIIVSSAKIDRSQTAGLVEAKFSLIRK